VSTKPTLEESFITSKDGARLRFVAWTRPDPVVARLLFVHGWAEYADRYQFPVDYLSPKGYACFGIDVRGHGGSAGKRSYIDSYDQYLDDVKAALDALPDCGEVPTFLVGHSQGGLVCTRLVQRGDDLDIAGLVLSSPFFGLARPLNAVERFMSKNLSKLWPALAVPSSLDTSHLTHDRAVVKAYEDDPKVFEKPVVRWAAETLKAQEASVAEAGKVKLPCLVMLGTEDQIVSPAVTRQFFEGCGSDDKELEEFSGLYHEIFNELERDEVVFPRLEKWLQAHAVATE